MSTRYDGPARAAVAVLFLAGACSRAGDDPVPVVAGPIGDPDATVGRVDVRPATDAATDAAGPADGAADAAGGTPDGSADSQDAPPVCTPEPEACNGVDDDCDGATDEDPGQLCDDGNPCTDGDTCSAGVCTVGPNTCSCLTDADCAAQDDEDLCNGLLFCDKSTMPYTCEIEPGSAVDCDTSGDGACATTACVPASGKCQTTLAGDGSPCDADGSVCSQGDSCQAGACAAGQSLACDDGNPCTDDACNPASGCSHVDNTLPCDADGSACTPGDACAGGTCKAGPLLDCDDGNGCTADSCNPATGQCGHDAQATEGTACDADGSVCTQGDACKAGVCTAGAAKPCDDGNPCTDDSCDPKAGCQSAANTKPCDDGNACTQGDACAAGTCQAGSNVCECQQDADCAGKNGGNLCAGQFFCAKTTSPYQCQLVPGSVVTCPTGQNGPCAQSQCQPASGQCSLVPLNEGKPCDADGSVCTQNDTCTAGKCTAGAALGCDDGNPCTTDACDPKIGCTHANNTAPCNADSNACTVGDLCAAGKCLPGAAKTCTDGLTCTVDSCNPATGACVFDGAPQQGKPCDADGSICTQNDACSSGKCVPGAPLPCADPNPCTTDTCDAKAGCQHAANTAACNADDNACTVGDVCKAGACVAGAAKVCNDNNPCTADSCDPKTGNCVFAGAPLDGNPCQAGQACTVGDSCQGGVCKAGQLASCDDANSCTKDECVPGVGCKYTNIKKGCNADENPCTVGDLCVNGECLPGALKTCDDGNHCTADGCDPETGECVNDAEEMNGKLCKPVSGCTMDACKGGVCLPGSVTQCDDGNPCTDDDCDSDWDCQHDPEPGVCDADGNGCTADTCQDMQCTVGPPRDCNDAYDCTLESCSTALGTCTFTPTDAPGCVKTFQRAYGGLGDDKAEKMLPTKDGGFLLVGRTDSFGAGLTDMYAVKVDACGNIQWHKAYGGAKEEAAWGVTATKDGGYLLVGESRTWIGTYVVKIDANGNHQWSSAYGGGGYDMGRMAVQTQDGGYLVLAETYSFGPGVPKKHNLFLLRLDPVGKLLWTKVFGGNVEGDAGFWAIESKDATGKADGFVVAGGTESWGYGDDDIWLLKIDPNGTLLWSLAYGGGSDEEARHILQTKDGGFIVTGYGHGWGAPKNDIFLLKTDAAGQYQWLRRYGGALYEEGHAIAELADGYAVGGFTSSYGAGSDDMVLMRTDLEGKLKWFKTIGGKHGDFGTAMTATPDGGFAVAGSSFTFKKGYRDFYLAKTGPTGVVACYTRDIDPVNGVVSVKVKPKKTVFTPDETTGGKQFVVATQVAVPTLVGATLTMCGCK